MSDDNKEGAGVPVNEHSFVQPVPDHCDRITWRGHYYHLREVTPPAVMPAAPSDAVLRGIYYSAHDALGLAEWTKRARAALSQAMQSQADRAPSMDRFEHVIRWVRDNYQDHSIASLCDGLRAAYYALCRPAEPAAGEQAGAVGHWVETVIAWTAGGRVLDTPEEAKAAKVRGFEVKELFTKTWSEVAAPGAAIAAREQEATPLPKGDLSKVWQAADDVCEWLNYEVSEKSPGLLKSIETLNEAMGRAEIRAGRAVKTALASRKEAPATPQGEALTDEAIETYLIGMLAKREFPSQEPGVVSYWLTPAEIRELFRLTQPTTVQQAEKGGA